MVKRDLLLTLKLLLVEGAHYENLGAILTRDPFEIWHDQVLEALSEASATLGGLPLEVLGRKAVAKVSPAASFARQAGELNKFLRTAIRVSELRNRLGQSAPSLRTLTGSTGPDK